MHRFIKELRRRAVFRTAGLYIGVCWIGIEAASVVLPVFEAPDWVMRAIIIATVIGFPVALVLAWVYEFTDHGIVVQEDATDTVVIPFGDRRMDFVVIGLLSVALIFSVYMNINRPGAPVEEPDPVSVLIANFNNTTGDPIFDETLEQTFGIGIEGASFVTAFSRSTAKRQIQRVREDGVLDEEGARLIAVREGIQLVLTGEISEDDGRYLFSVRAIEPVDGTNIAEVERTASDRANVLTAVTEATNEIREDLGDPNIGEEAERIIETFTAGSLQAAHDYTQAQVIADEGNYEGAIELYQSALASDPNFGRAYSGWAVAAHNLGRSSEAEEAWNKALALQETMTERERYRTLGTYYMVVSGNYQKAIENYEALVSKYPADGPGHNNLAVSYFMTLDFEKAQQEGQRVLDIYPSNLFYKQNAALYAMYAGDFAAAESEALAVIESDDTRYYARLPVAMAAMSRGELETARAAYEDMVQTGASGAAHGAVGLADLDIFRGDFAAAAGRLQASIELDLASGNQYMAGAKYLALAEAQLLNGDAHDIVVQTIQSGLEVSAGLSQQVGAAQLYLAMGRSQEAAMIADELAKGLQPQNRAYAAMINGIIHSLYGEHALALDALVSGSQLMDFWLIRRELGKAYLRAGSYAEALAELDTSNRRRGEATAVFLDDLPTWRYLAELRYWRGVAQQEIGMQNAARESLESYLALRGDGELADDARERLAAL